MVRVGKRRRRAPLPGEEGGHSEARGRVVPHGLRPRTQRALAGLHAADVQRRDLDRGAGDLLVGQVLVQKTVHTTMHLFQIHLLVLKRRSGGVEEDRGETGGGGGGGRRDTEAEIGDGPVSQTVSRLLELHAFSICHVLVAFVLN